MVYLVGAGPGDEGLISCKGMELIKDCDVIIYDNLGTYQLLEYVSDNCEKIYVGKRNGHHSAKQEEINKIIVESAKKYKKVVRLKGGDPFVFGRGGEEIEALEEQGLEYQVVPGITSAVSVPALFGIPVTHRGISKSFQVITGHTKAEEGFPRKQVQNFAKSGGTGVFLMGLSHLEEIAKCLTYSGMDEKTGIAVISKGCMPGEKIVKGNLGNIVSKVEKEGVTTPAIIVVGETVNCNFVCGTVDKKMHVGLIGTASLRNKLKKDLEEYGAKVYSLCNMKIVVGPDTDKLYQAVANVRDYSWVVFTSQNAIDIFFDAMKQKGVDIRQLADTKFAVVGEGTRNALLERGIVADLMPDTYTTFELAKLLCERVLTNEKILLPRAVQGSTIITKLLEQSKLSFDDLHVYDVVGQNKASADYLKELDVIAFASASGVKSFFDNDKILVETIKKNKVKIACIGEMTAQKVEEYGLKAAIISDKFCVENFVKCIIESKS